MHINDRIDKFAILFKLLQITSSRNDKEYFVKQLSTAFPELKEDYEYIQETLAGQHPIGFTLHTIQNQPTYVNHPDIKTIKQAIFYLECLPDRTEQRTIGAILNLGGLLTSFLMPIVNRTLKLGITNKQSNNLTPMLAKKYPDDVRIQVPTLFHLQEKLDGHRCIAYFNEEINKWCFQSRNEKPKEYNLDMSWADKSHIFDGEVMSSKHATSKDFNQSGILNSKYKDKSQIHYFIYDIVDDSLPYAARLKILEDYTIQQNRHPEQFTDANTSILPTLDVIILYPDKSIEATNKIDKHFTDILNKGGEGLMLRNAHATYQHKRTCDLLKYKDVQTMDMKVIGLTLGTGKYEGLTGALICELYDDQNNYIKCNVGSGLSDEQRQLPSSFWMNKIVEIAYFGVSQNKNTQGTLEYSLRFPRLKKIREDKDDTSQY